MAISVKKTVLHIIYTISFKERILILISFLYFMIKKDVWCTFAYAQSRLPFFCV